MRVQLYWNLSGVVEKEWAGFAYDNFLLKQDIELGWIRHVMRQASMYRLRGVSPDSEWMPWVISEWIGEPGSGNGLLFLTHPMTTEEQRNLLLIMMGVLPLVAGVWDAYSYKKAERELIRQYGFMRRVFTKARSLLDSSDSDRFNRKVLRALGRAALEVAPQRGTWPPLR